MLVLAKMLKPLQVLLVQLDANWFGSESGPDQLAGLCRFCTVQ